MAAPLVELQPRLRIDLIPDPTLVREARAALAAELLDAYRRAPWTGINRDLQVKKLRQASALLGGLLAEETRG